MEPTSKIETLNDPRIDRLIKEVLPLASEWKKQHPRGGEGKAPCPICAGTISYTVAGYNRHVSAKCDGCWVEWIE